MVNAIILEDSSTQLWQLTVDDSGLLHSATIGSGTVNTVILNDPSYSASWQLGITTGGLLTTTSVSFSEAYPIDFTLTSHTGMTIWNLGVTLIGLLTTTQLFGTYAIEDYGQMISFATH